MDTLPPEVLFMILDHVDGTSLRALLCSCTAYSELYNTYWRSIVRRVADNTCRPTGLVYQALRASLCEGKLHCRYFLYQYRLPAHGSARSRLTTTRRGRFFMSWKIWPSRDIVNVSAYDGCPWEAVNRLTTMSMDVAGIADWFTDPARQWLSSRHSREQVKHALWICQLASAITWPVDIEVAGYLHLPFPNLLGQPLGHDTDVDFSSFQLHMLRVTLRGLLYTHLVVLRDVLQDFVRAIETLVRHGLYPHPDSLLYSVFATKGIARVLEFYLEKRLEQYHHVPTGPLKFPVNRPPSPSYGQLLPEDVEAYKNFCKNVGDETYLATQGTLAPLRPWMQYRRLSKYLETFRPLLGMWGKCWKVSETVENPGVEVPGELAEEELVVQLEILGNRYGDAERPWNRL